MARIKDIEFILDELKQTMDTDAIQSLAQQTPNDFNIDWVLNDMRLKDKFSVPALKRAIQHAPKPEAQRCGRCNDGFIYTLNRQVLKEMQDPIKFPLQIPKAMTYCPNCGTNTAHMQKIVDSMTDEERAWEFVILYDYAIYHLNLHITPENFNPRDYWNIILEPMLDTEQTQLMHEILRYAQNSGKLDPEFAAQTIFTQTQKVLQTGGKHV